MTAEVARTGGLPASAPRELLALALEVLRRFPTRTRDARFWHVQALVVVATVPHYVIEVAGFTNPFETLHGLAVTMYVIPLLYAAIHFGWEGALLTGLECALLTSPSMWIWHRSEYHWFAELGQLAITLPVGFLVAWRVDKEAVQRRRAETTSARLALLNEVGEDLSQTLEVEQHLPAVLRRLQSGLGLRSVWLVLEPESDDGTPTVLVEGQPVGPTGLPVDGTNGGALLRPAALAANDAAVVIPLTGEGGHLGSLGAMAAVGEELGDDQIDVVSTVAQEVRVAVENARLYRERQESLQSYARQVTQAQEEERLRVARELHDETAQELVHLVRGLEALEDSQELPAQIEGLVSMARETLRSVRRFSRDLRPAVLDDLGLLAAIEMVVDEADGRLANGADLVVTGEPRRVDRAAELALFRIAQEALRNVDKHAGATSATVELGFQSDEITLSISDDGRGFSPPKQLSQLARSGSLGLLGMKERAELLGGRFEVSSGPGAGSRLVATISAGAASDKDR